MSDTLRLNLEDLVRHYYDRTDAHVAAALLDRWIGGRRQKQLATLLRDHREEGIYSSLELGRRRAVDELFIFYGLLEVGIVAGYLPWPLPGDLADRARRHLSDPAVRPYYRQFYPLDLSAMLNARLSGWRGPRARLTRRSESLFLQLLDLSTELEANESVDTFLWFMEDGYTEGANLADLYRALGSVDSYLEHLTRPPAEREVLDRAVVGIGEFLLFCRSLDGQLLQAADLPDLQRAMWCHHAYWFRSVAHDMEEVLGRIDTLVRGWRRSDGASGRELRPDSRLMRLVRGAYRFRTRAIRVPISKGEPLMSMARRERPTILAEASELAPAGRPVR